MDFANAFNIIDREIIWKSMNHYGIPPMFINIIKELYEGSSYQIIHNSKLTNPFPVKTGVRQGCMLSPLIFLLVIDWVTKRTFSNNKKKYNGH